MRVTIVAISFLLKTGIYFTFGEDVETGSNPSDNYTERQSKILDGKPVNPPHSRPYVVQLPTIGHYGEDAIFVGTVYDEWTILTGGSFVSNVKKVIAGKYYLNKYESSQQERQICSISVHPDIGGPDGRKTAYSYGMIHLREPLIFNEYVSKISLAKVSSTPAGYCTMIGWGRTKPGTSQQPSEVLLQSNVTWRPPKDCGKDTHRTVICANQGACFYDWGAPAVCNDGVDVLVGYTAAIFDDCQQPLVASMAAMPREWFSRELDNARGKCRQPSTPQSTTRSTRSTARSTRSTAPPTRPPAPPTKPPVPQLPEECECELRGYCRWFEICIEDEWSRRRLCSNDLYWLPNNITGGTCAHFESLPGYLQKEYKDDPDCYKCEWYQEIKDVCSPRYTFRDADGNTHAMSCPAAPSGKSQLYWQLKMKTCDECIHAIDHRGRPCLCN